MKQVHPVAALSSHLENLEPRQLFAYAAADYFPLNTSTVSNYKATADGQSTTVVRTMGATNSLGVNTTRVRDKTTIAGKQLLIDRDYVQGKTGLGLYRTAVTSSDFTAVLSDRVAVPMLPKTFLTGKVSAWSKLPVQASITVPKYGISNLPLVGSDTGTTTVANNGNVTMLGYTFVNTIKVTTTRSEAYSVSFAGITYTATFSISEVQVLAGTVGVLSGSISFNGHLKGGLIDQTEVASETNTLTSTNLLSGFTSVSSGTLHVSGTSGNDTFSIGYDGGTSKFLVVRNGVGKDVSTSGLTGLFIDAGGGDDVVNPPKIGRMRTTMMGGAGNDSLCGGIGRDSINGGAGNDTLVGGPGRDNIFGDIGDDVLNGNSGNDHLDGGPGTDKAKLDSADTRISIEVLV